MKFGKQILSQQISGWGPYYLDYKFLKKIINSLEKGRITDAALLATGMRPEPPSPAVVASGAGAHGAGAPDTVAESGSATQAAGRPEPRDQTQQDREREAAAAAATQILIGGQSSGDGPDELKLHRAAFFFKLERELEKVCSILYLYRLFLP